MFSFFIEESFWKLLFSGFSWKYLFGFISCKACLPRNMSTASILFQFGDTFIRPVSAGQILHHSSWRCPEAASPLSDSVRKDRLTTHSWFRTWEHAAQLCFGSDDPGWVTSVASFLCGQQQHKEGRKSPEHIPIFLWLSWRTGFGLQSVPTYKTLLFCVMI